MTIRHLRILIAVADTGQMSAAAKQLYITQPTVSQAIADIESAYGVRVFERLSRKLYITPAGAQMLDYARHIVSAFDEMEERMRTAVQSPMLQVGATITVGSSVMPDIVSGFEARYPDCRIHVTVDNTMRMEEMLLKSLLDVALMEGKVKSPDLLTKPVIRDELVLIVPTRHPFAGRDSIRPQELAGQPFVLREKNSSTRELFESRLRPLGIEVEAKWSCQSADAILNAVAEGQGLSVVSRRAAEGAAEKGLIRITGIEEMDLTREFSLIYHKNKFLSPPLRRFMSVCEAYGDGWER